MNNSNKVLGGRTDGFGLKKLRGPMSAKRKETGTEQPPDHDVQASTTISPTTEDYAQASTTISPTTNL
eukprot:3092505-Amphidinium_carterae.1